MDAYSIMAEPAISNALDTARRTIEREITKRRIRPLEATVKHLRRKLQENGIEDWIPVSEAPKDEIILGETKNDYGDDFELIVYREPEGMLPGWFGYQTGQRIPRADIRRVKRVTHV